MGKKTFGWVLGSLLVLIGLSIAIVQLKNNDDLALTDIDFVSSTIGILEEALTFSYLLDYADVITIGTVTGSDLLNESRPVKTVVIEDPISGETSGKEILVYVDEELVEQGETYLFFLSSFDSTLYDKHFYVQHNEFIVHVEDDGQLLRLTDAYDKTYERPFVENEYNHVTTLTKEIKVLHKANNQQEQVRHFSSSEELESAADVIAQIEVDSLFDDRGIATITYTLIESSKGSLDHSFLLLPSNKIEEGKQYMLYLTRSENDLTLVTRDSSIIEIKDTD